MKKLVSLVSVGALASAASISPISSVAAFSAEDTTGRAYFSFMFGAGEPVKDSIQYGFQLKQSWDQDDDVIDPFAAPRSLTVFDFAMDSEGLAKANMLGLDTIKVYDIWTGKDRLNQNANGAGGGNNTGLFIAGGIAGGVILCFVLDWDPCDDNNKKNGVEVANCLLEDSLVLDAKGQEVCVCDVGIGDVVLAMDPVSQQPIATRVTNAMYDHWRNAYYVINGKLRITNDHPVIVYRNGNAEWVRVEDVQVGDVIAALDGVVEVETIQRVNEGAMTVYLETELGNFLAVGGTDTYLVSGNYASKQSLAMARQAA